MRRFLRKIRKPNKKGSLKNKILITIGIIILGFLFGVFQKWLDSKAINELPMIIQQIDFGNYLGRLPIYILLCTIISVSSKTPLRASINVFSFLISMLSGYYLYSYYVLGFLSVSYMLIWVTIAIGSIFIAPICWYAKGKGKISILISSIILGVMLSQAVFFFQGIRITHILDFLTWIVGVLVLYRKPKEFSLQLVLALIIALIVQMKVSYFV